MHVLGGAQFSTYERDMARRIDALFPRTCVVSWYTAAFHCCTSIGTTARSGSLHRSKRPLVLFSVISIRIFGVRRPRVKDKAGASGVGCTRGLGGTVRCAIHHLYSQALKR
jgi:hypothetical protein